ncbi:Uncharacterised protein [BD1-7 clade bacterium]|uniref:Uncharacterized protein n=1 Tax=BD1-7 clade bacterium TaxID=2029982 RepID=A0A5S9NX09_9GAMM|nr:Uncharacterised protein [BD1-7 clade bacterium]CAA0095907.1 Uncharacterised protein [BD1-7 clade bacterium]
MNKLLKIQIFLVLSLGQFAFAGGELIDLFGKKCKNSEVLYPFDKMGDYVAYQFCDDAVGTQLGFILRVYGDEVARVGSWSQYSRFWQNGGWSIDVKQIYFPAFNSRYVYVLTSDIYGDNSLYELDLLKRRYDILLNGEKEKRILSLDKISKKYLFFGEKDIEIRHDLLIPEK